MFVPQTHYHAIQDGDDDEDAEDIIDDLQCLPLPLKPAPRSHLGALKTPMPLRMPQPASQATAPATADVSPAAVANSTVRMDVFRSRPRASTSTTNPASVHTSSAGPDQPYTVRRASDHNLDLRHPIPDLQTIQGAYVGNIEQLEQTAERLSMSSSIEAAIRDLHTEQKLADESRRNSLISASAKVSSSHYMSSASSIVEVNNTARSGGFSPAGIDYMMSPVGSPGTTSAGLGRRLSKSSKLPSHAESDQEARPGDSYSRSPPSPRIIPLEPHKQQPSSPQMSLPILDIDFDRPPTPQAHAAGHLTTSGSMDDTMAPGDEIFADFDGVHSPRLPESEEQLHGHPPRHVEFQSQSPGSLPDDLQHSVNRPLAHPRPQSFLDPSTGQEMVWYPAPVPMMLNLPQRLSQQPSTLERNKRRSKVMSTVPAAARQSAIWLPDVLERDDEPNLAENDEAQNMEYLPQHQRMSMGGRRTTQDFQHVPPQLRATAFFDMPAPETTVAMANKSAVHTLDNILDASAFAPVSAFTDHAFAGALGSEVYGREPPRHARSSTQLLSVDADAKKRSSTFTLFRRRESSNPLLDGEGDRSQTISNLVPAKRRTTLDDEEGEDDETDEEELEGRVNNPEEEHYHGPPTTLLAELQLRKQQQKLRTRPTASAYPQGMHSTLLELDTVAQMEKNTRKMRRVNLAWEDPDAEADAGADEDEDVPLAVLAARREIAAQDSKRPMGLMERREIEDNEPLSKRRERLYGKRASTMMHVPAYEPAEEDEHEEETLAQRRERLKAEGRGATGLPTTRPVSGDFASEMMSQFGGEALVPERAPTPEDETLGQRKTRLAANAQIEAKAQAARPKPNRYSTNPAPTTGLPKRRSMADLLQVHPGASSGSNNKALGIAPGSLLDLHNAQKKQLLQQRASTMLNMGGAAVPVATQMHPAQHQPGPQWQQQNGAGGGYSGGFAYVPPEYPYGGYAVNPNMNGGGYGTNMNGMGYNGRNLNMSGGGYGMNPNGGGYGMSTNMGGMGMNMNNTGGMNGMGMNMNMNGMNSMNNLSMNMFQIPQQMSQLNPAQAERVERWRMGVGL